MEHEISPNCRLLVEASSSGRGKLKLHVWRTYDASNVNAFPVDASF